MTLWYQLDTQQTLETLSTDSARGLNTREAEARLAQYGPNELKDQGGRSPWRIFWEQLTATMVLILIAAAVISGLLGSYKDTVAISAIVILYALLGFVQEYRAEKAMAALRRLAVPVVKVVRDGSLAEISARDLAPGDVVLVEAGNVIPADARILESVNLRIQEAALTGESEPVEKISAALPAQELPLGDRRNMAYMGTTVTQGRGTLAITATGMETELGKIAALIQGVGHTQTPLQRRLDGLGKTLAVVGLAVAALIFVLGLLRGDDPIYLLLTAVSVAVAIVPEGLPAVVTITLALGAQSMLQRRALIRRLPAVETLGSVTHICSDKTGTLTENRMTVVILDVAGHEVDLSEVMKHGVATLDHPHHNPSTSPFPLLLVGGALCNDAQMVADGVGDHFHALGDPTEGALVVAAAHLGYWKADLEQTLPRLAEIPFDSDRKRMTTVHGHRAGGPPGDEAPPLPSWPYVSFAKGAVDGLLALSTQVWTGGEAAPLDAEWRRRILAANERLAAKGMRVLGVAVRPLAQAPAAAEMDLLESDLTFVGLFGMIDPPRREVRAAVATSRAAGIRPIMITGDHPLTALHIARELGIAQNDRVLTGLDLERLPVGELAAAVEDVSVFARVSPEHKLKIVQALQEKGQIVAMTGDGVNDAPALKKADIGVAMGITGTDVSKEAADMVLLDDNFATIVAAVEQGRVIYDNIRKFVKFSVAGNLGKVLVMLLAPFLGKPLPLLPLQLLWLNLLTDGLLGLGLGVEPAERGTMRRSPYAPGESIFSRGAGVHIIGVGVLIGALGLAVGSWYYFTGHPAWQTMVFSTLAFAQMWQALGARSTRDSLFTLGIFSNPTLLAMLGITFALQLAVIYVPVMQAVFNTKPLLPTDLGIALALSSIIFIAIELEKWLARRREPLAEA